MERRDRARVLLPIHGPRLIVVLGCTVGAGQTVTTLMLGDVLASLRGEPVAALDLNPGQTSLADMARTSPAGTARGLLAGATPAVPGQRGGGRLDLIAHDSAPDDGQALADEEYARVIEILTSRYPLTLTDPGASAVARVLSAADQLILVAPASSDAARAVAMTMEWLDGHGYGELCTGAITVINGVSKRSMSHVEQAELVVRGRCRAIVRVPWDDHLGAPPAEQGISDAAAADTESRFAQLRPPVQHAYTALAGVLVSALAVGGSRMAPTSGRTTMSGRTRGRSRLSLRYFDDRILLTESHAWAYYRLPTQPMSSPRRRSGRPWPPTSRSRWPRSGCRTPRSTCASCTAPTRRRSGRPSWTPRRTGGRAGGTTWMRCTATCGRRTSGPRRSTWASGWGSAACARSWAAGCSPGSSAPTGPASRPWASTTRRSAPRRSPAGRTTPSGSAGRSGPAPSTRGTPRATRSPGWSGTR